jgi:hypothetical protein
MSLSRLLLKNRSLAPAAVRLFSTSRLAASAAPLDFSKLTIEKTNTPKTLPPPEKLVFGHTFTGTYFCYYTGPLYVWCPLVVFLFRQIAVKIFPVDLDPTL